MDIDEPAQGQFSLPFTQIAQGDVQPEGKKKQNDEIENLRGSQKLSFRSLKPERSKGFS